LDLSSMLSDVVKSWTTAAFMGSPREDGPTRTFALAWSHCVGALVDDVQVTLRTQRCMCVAPVRGQARCYMPNSLSNLAIWPEMSGSNGEVALTAARWASHIS
jgi:hypothetical protein